MKGGARVQIVVEWIDFRRVPPAPTHYPAHFVDWSRVNKEMRDAEMRVDCVKLMPNRLGRMWFIKQPA